MCAPMFSLAPWKTPSATGIAAFDHRKNRHIWPPCPDHPTTLHALYTIAALARGGPCHKTDASLVLAAEPECEDTTDGRIRCSRRRPSPPDRICISPQFGDGSKIESSREEEAEAAF